MARFQVTDTTVAQALHRIAEITRDAVPAAELVGMSMLGDDGQPTTTVYTDADSPAIDEAQYREGKGPCLDAWHDNVVLRLGRVEDWADRYPGFVTACLEHEVHSTLSLPMAAGDIRFGAMNIYARLPEAFADDDESLAQDLATAGSAVLANVSAYRTALDLSQQLAEAMKSRAVIEQAKGILMAHTPGLTADGAFDVLRRASQRENVKLREIAARMVERQTGISVQEGGQD